MPGQNDKAILQSFLPIVTTYTVCSEQAPLEAVAADSRLLAQVFYEHQQKAGYDCLPIMGDSTYVAEAFGCEIGYDPREPFVKQTLALTDTAEVARLDIPQVDDHPRLLAMLQAVGILARQADNKMPVLVNSPGPLSSAGRIMGIDNLMLNMALNPALVKGLLEKVPRFIVAYTEALIEWGADIIFLPDPMASSDLISPAMFNEFVMPMLKHQVGRIDKPILLHICGKIMPIAGDMADTGATLLSIDQQVDIQSMREAIGPGVLIGGNLDPVEMIEKKTAEQIASAARRCCRQAGENFILMPGCTITPRTPVENIKALIETAKNELEPQRPKPAADSNPHRAS